MSKLEILKNILIHALLPIAVVGGGLYMVYHFFGNGALFIGGVIVYVLSMWQSHKNKKQKVSDALTKLKDDSTPYELSIMLMRVHGIAPESDEVHRLIVKLAEKLSPDSKRSK
jgi:hypothetical protein